MLRTYRGLLRGERIEWTDLPPECRKEGVPVYVTILEPEHEVRRSRGDEMADALGELARQGGVASIPDPQVWQRKVRNDRPLPGREA